MRKTLLIFGILFSALIIIVGLGPLFISNTSAVTESILIDSPIKKCYQFVSNLDHYKQFDSRCKKDTACQTWTTNSVNNKQTYYWVSENDVIGKGELEMLVLKDSEQLRLELRRKRPWKETRIIVFNFLPQDKGTTISCTEIVALPYIVRYFKESIENTISSDLKNNLEELRIILSKG